MTEEQMVAALKLKGWRIEPPLSQENCAHPLAMRMGSGQVSFAGSSRMSWTCMKCGKTEGWETPVRSSQAFDWQNMGWSTGCSK